MAKKAPGGIGETLKTIVYAIVIALFIRTFFYEPFSIPSASMVPTLLVGDYLFVSKFSYGYSRYSLPLGLPLFSGRIFFNEPHRGDVVVFKLPCSFPQLDSQTAAVYQSRCDNTTDFIKRIVGLPGDKIQMKDGILNINGTPIKRDRLEPYFYSENGRTTTYTQYIETLPNGYKHNIIEVSDDQPLDRTDEFTVPPGHYFMMGDNRDDSADSRDPTSGVGYVPAENIVGRVPSFLFYLDRRLCALVGSVEVAVHGAVRAFVLRHPLMEAAAGGLDTLQATLGHRFAQKDLLIEALTHPSAIRRKGISRRGYERLEFLGDRVLGLIVAEFLWRHFPDEAEGELTRRHTHLVRREALAEVAQAVGLGARLIVSKGEDGAGVRDNQSVMADVCEAVIAALYLDGGLEAARQFVEAAVGEAPQWLARPAARSQNHLAGMGAGARPAASRL